MVPHHTDDAFVMWKSIKEMRFSRYRISFSVVFIYRCTHTFNCFERIKMKIIVRIVLNVIFLV